MPRKNLNVDGGTGGGIKCNKVRKRGSSSSSSSSLVRNYRLKRAILVGKRGGGGGGSSTPVPSWKMSSAKTGGGGGDSRGKEVSVSARKLGATLWEINGGNLEERRKSDETEHCCLKKDSILKDYYSSSNLEALALLCWSDPSSSPPPVPEGRMVDRPDFPTHHWRRSSINSQKILPSSSSEFNIRGGGVGGGGAYNSLHNTISLMEVVSRL